MEMTIKQRVINRIDLTELSKHFTFIEIGLAFYTPADYIIKTEKLQRIDRETKSKPDKVDEMSLGLGAWKELKESSMYKHLKK